MEINKKKIQAMAMILAITLVIVLEQYNHYEENQRLNYFRSISSTSLFPDSTNGVNMEKYNEALNNPVGKIYTDYVIRRDNLTTDNYQIVNEGGKLKIVGIIKDEK